MMEEVVIIITASDEGEAEKVAKILLEERLAACVNIHPRIRSLYWWEGKIQDDGEAMMIVKTRRELFSEVVRKVKEVHSYTVPEIIAVPIIEGSEDYLRWIGEVTKK